ncbi:MAG: AtpZ/AtpI family protein [Pirellulaceae bacterium]
MNHHDPQQRRPDVRKSLARDVSRRRRREAGHGSFWRSLGVLGMVGWPIAVGAAGGALLGHRLDLQFQGGIRYTLMLLMIGVAGGCFAAWRAVTRRSS